MSKKRLLTFIGLFIVTNVCLIFFDQHENVERVSNISDWTTVDLRDMEEVLGQKGMVTGEKHHVYFDQSRGEFSEMLVQDSMEVSTGDPLYTYNVSDYTQESNRLNQEVARLTDEINSIEMLITQLENYPIEETSYDTSVFIEDDEVSVDISHVENIETEFQKVQFIMEMEHEVSIRQANLDSVEAQLSELESTGETVTVTSPYDGIVHSVSAELDDPLITILNREWYVEAALSESEQKQVEEGMEVRMNGEENGEVSHVSPVASELDLNKPSQYTMNVQFEDEGELIPGEKVHFDVILEKSEATSVIREEHLVGESGLWAMTDTGKLHYLDVSTGIQMEHWLEVEDIPEGTHISTSPKERFHDGTEVTTRLNLSEVSWFELLDVAKREPVIKGMLFR
ncbi:efflux RND transporter periplasmic adaptor subunit [Alkalibacillus haloalkaliphilus]|uniref:efflux RND transporter periplasmic adaptor subunit n=1 Tax=Alkalibacillus haloalkaliphilus TaxID=94136 RepID=UPI00035EC5FC|nr:HlyD family efflux transporter periplasmic adaptor subunit [Alkalibacillus haloalkaliphilus]